MKIEQTITDKGTSTIITLHDGETLDVNLVGQPAGAEPVRGGLDEKLILRVTNGRAFMTSFHSSKELRSDDASRVYEITPYSVQPSSHDIRNAVTQETPGTDLICDGCGRGPLRPDKAQSGDRCMRVTETHKRSEQTCGHFRAVTKATETS